MSERAEACIGCLLWESGRADLLESVRVHIEKIPAAERTAQALYDDRLAVCRACCHLIGGTCLKCGCYPEFRAAFRTQRCPVKKWQVYKEE
ncbi:MAG: hypothetical protein IJT44_07160 [Clostridia bacterium]|nr:hypothetical protein [Clostridia bacterium]